MNKNFTHIGIFLLLASLGLSQSLCLAADSKCNMQSLHKTSMQYIHNKEFDKALPLFNACIAEHPKDPNLYNNRGNIYKQMGKYNEAVSDYQKAISLNPKFTTPYNGMATIYLKTGQIDRGLDILNQLKEIDPNNIQGALNRAPFEVMLKDYDSAIKDYTIALKDKKNSIYYKERAYAYLASSKPKQAIADYESYFKAGHSSAEAYKYLGISYEITGDNEKAIECFRKAAELYKKENNLDEYNSLMRIFRGN